MSEVWGNLIAAAQEMGIAYLGQSLEALGRIVSDEQIKRRGKPECYARSFSAREQVCQRCQLWDLCGAATILPAFALEPHDFGACDKCDGDLFVPLFNGDGTIFDYGCTTGGCDQTEEKQAASMGGPGNV
jgi:hypothetical protein